MPAPYNYQIAQPVNPMAMVQDAMRLKGMVDQQRTQQQQAQQNAVLRGKLAELSQNPTADNILSFVAGNPQFMDKFKPLLDRADKNQLNMMRMAATKGYMALSAGKPQIAVEFYNDTAEALSNSGQDEEAKMFTDIAKIIELNPNIMKTDLGIFSAAFDPDNFKKIAEQMSEKPEQDIKESEARTKKILAELKEAALVTGGKIAPKDRPDWELKLRNQYLKEGGEEFRKINRAYRNIEGASLTGVGGLTSILSFMKIIDPTSVVSSTEKATAENAPGWSSSMRTLWNRYFSEGELSDTAAKQFKAEALKMRNNAAKDSERARKRISVQSKKYGLDLSNIFTPDNEDAEIVEKQTGGERQVKPEVGDTPFTPPAGARIRVYDPATGTFK